MKLLYIKGDSVVIKFDLPELKQALAILETFAAFFKSQSIKKMAEEVKGDIFPALAEKQEEGQYFHTCFTCFCDIDTRKDPFIHRFIEENEYYIHRKCKMLHPYPKGH